MTQALPALSVLDLAPVLSGSTAADAIRNVVSLGCLAERHGYRRIWYAEHHAMAAVGSSAPEVLIAHVAANTTAIRVGSGGVMLPNHAPLRIAESFLTLEALHPGRIDLGLGRAPGGVPGASRALRAHPGDQFATQVAELQGFANGDMPSHLAGLPLQAMPSGVPLPPIWVLGSSGASARWAGSQGMGYSFASHFSADPPAPAMHAYRNAFVSSPQFAEPHAILGVAVICAATQADADYLSASMDLHWLRIDQGQFMPLPSPEEAMAYPWTEWERDLIRGRRERSVIGTPQYVRSRLLAMAESSGANELMLTTQIHDPQARLESYRLIAEAMH